MENPLHNSTLARAFNNVLGDFSRLLQQEMQLAKAEFSEDIGAQIRGGVWAAAAALFGVLALMAAAEPPCSRCGRRASNLIGLV